MSVLVTFTEFFPSDPLADSTPSDAPQRFGDAGAASTAVHCGSGMELVTPAVGPAAVGYSYEPEDGGPVQLPPVWRCRCGFQLDAWIRSPYAHAFQDDAAGPNMPFFAALSA